MGRKFDLHHGDCLDVMSKMESSSIDTIITDPPYGLNFMNKGWDRGVPSVPYWEAALQVAKPGAMLLAFGGTRTYHRLACAIEDAGWEIRDCIQWIYGSGMPKSHDIGKATKAAEWSGFGTGLKPAYEPIIVAMKPIDKTYKSNALTHGVAGLNIEAGRIPILDGAKMARSNADGKNGWKNSSGGPNNAALHGEPSGRWPANVMLDEDAAIMLDDLSGRGLKSGAPIDGMDTTQGIYGNYAIGRSGAHHDDSGGASRFFYCAKAGRVERDLGLDGFEVKLIGDGREKAIDNGYQRGLTPRKNTHTTVKPLSLMQYLCKLTRPPTGGVVLDPFAGSGTTGMAALSTGRDFVGIELEHEYIKISRARIGHIARVMSGEVPPKRVASDSVSDAPLFSLLDEVK